VEEPFDAAPSWFLRTTFDRYSEDSATSPSLACWSRFSRADVSFNFSFDVLPRRLRLHGWPVSRLRRLCFCPAFVAFVTGRPFARAIEKLRALDLPLTRDSSGKPNRDCALLTQY
jgi:hypothetical protein